MSARPCPCERTSLQHLFCQGFTLIELMLVVLLLSTIALWTAPNLSNWLEKNRIDALAREFLSHLIYAQHEAIARTHPVTLCRSDKTGQCTNTAQHCGKNYVAPYDWSCGYAVRIEEYTAHTASHLLKTRLLNAEATIHGSSAPLIFRPLTGQIIGGIRHFEFAPSSLTSASREPSMQRCIYISVGGRARLARGACQKS